MKTNFSDNPETNGVKGFVVFIVTLLLLFFVLSRGAMAAEGTLSDSSIATDSSVQANQPVATEAVSEAVSQPATDTVKEEVPDTMHQVLNELKAGNEDSPVMAVIMIIAVIGIVGLAVYLSFKDYKPGTPKAKK